jgi:hypothetical protein
VPPPQVRVRHVADREGDIYDWLAAPRPSNTHVLLRVAQAHRVVATGPCGAEGPVGTVAAAAPPGTYAPTVPRADGRPSRQAVLEVRVAAVQLIAPRHTPANVRRPAADVWLIEAREIDPPTDPPVCWCLVTTQPIIALDDATGALRE